MPRKAAQQALLDWKAGRGFLAENLERRARKLDDRDRALALKLALGVCRNKTLISYRLTPLLHRGNVPDPLYAILQLGAYQHGWMPDLPHHALLHPLVDLARQQGGDKAAGFCNAVLRSLQKQNLPDPEGYEKKALAIRFSHPKWLVKKWQMQMDSKSLLRRLSGNNTQPKLWLRMNPKKTTISELTAELGISEEEVLFQRYLPWKKKARELLSHPAFLRGACSVQDPAAWLVCRLLEVEKGQTVLDACAAPGGKSLLLAESNPEVHLVSADLSHNRLLGLVPEANRLGVFTPSCVTCDGIFLPFRKKFSRILLDVPCSNLGVVARRPEAKWLLPETLQRHGEQQLRLLEGVASCLAPGGLLVYATCSPEEEETSLVVQNFLDKNPSFSLENAVPILGDEWCRNSCLHLFPGEQSLDGFFAARIRNTT